MLQFFRKIRYGLAKDQQFFKYSRYAIGEIVLVVIGILIALQINNWNEERKFRKEESAYLKRLVSENKDDLETFKIIRNNLSKGIETIELFSQSLKEPSVSDSALVLAANEYFRYGSIYPVFTSSTSTFDDLKSTGNLNVISNANLRDKIIKHYARHKEIIDRIEVGNNWALPIDAQFTMQNDIMRFEPSTSFLFPKEPYESYANELRENQIKYMSNIASHYWINKDCIRILDDISIETSQLIGEIENELKD